VQFLKIYILQGSAATHLRCGGIFNNSFTANCPHSVPVKECSKSVNHIYLAKVWWHVFLWFTV